MVVEVCIGVVADAVAGVAVEAVAGVVVGIAAGIAAIEGEVGPAAVVAAHMKAALVVEWFVRLVEKSHGHIVLVVVVDCMTFVCMDLPNLQD